MKTSSKPSAMPENKETAQQIAIDGPVGSGKSDISVRLAQELGYVYVYTGAMYRALAYLCNQHKVGYKDEINAVRLLNEHTIDLSPALPGSKRPCTVSVDGKDITEELFTPVMDQPTSDVSTIPAVRKLMVARQQELAMGRDVIMEGRDIGKRVLPNASLKIYLTADVKERAKRRLEQWQKKGITTKTYEEALQETIDRDYQDMHRPYDPLEKLPDAWELDTTGLTQDAVIEKIKEEMKKRGLI